MIAAWKLWWAGKFTARHNACGETARFDDAGPRARWMDAHVCEATT